MAIPAQNHIQILLRFTCFDHFHRLLHFISRKIISKTTCLRIRAAHVLLFPKETTRQLHRTLIFDLPHLQKAFFSPPLPQIKTYLQQYQKSKQLNLSQITVLDYSQILPLHSILIRVQPKIFLNLSIVAHQP
jgi:hypothetical protein